MTRIEEVKKLRKGAVGDGEKFFLSELKKIFLVVSKKRETRKVKEVCSKPQYGYTDSAKKEPVGPKFLRITDIQNGQVNWDQVPFCICPIAEKYLLQPGDILFARSGATTGKSFLVKEPPESVFASYLIRIKTQRGTYPAYLYWYFQSPLYWSQVIEERKGSAQPNMNGKKLSNIIVPCPPLPEQKQIVAYLDNLHEKVDKLKKLQKETENELEQLTPSILDRAFKGEL